MGIKRLQKYAVEDKDWVFYKTFDTKDLKNKMIVVDGSQCARFLYKGLDVLRGGQYAELRGRCKAFKDLFYKLSCDLVFIFDGLPVEEKMGRWRQRRETNAKIMADVFKEWQTPKDPELPYGLVPEGVVPCARAAFKDLGCTVGLSATDCDTELAELARSDRCVGVLSDDTDFLLYEGMKGLIPFNRLGIVWKKDTTGITAELVKMEFCIPDDLARKPDIPVADLPIWASFVGNDNMSDDTLTGLPEENNIVSTKILSMLHEKLKKKYNRSNVSEAIAEMLRNAPVDARNDLGKIVRNAIGDEFRVDWRVVQRSIDVYKFSVEDNSSCDGVLQYVEEKHVSCVVPTTVFTVMKCRSLRFGVVLEDLSTYQAKYPPTEMVSRGLLHRMYAVLLKEFDNKRVTEYRLWRCKLKKELVAASGLPRCVHHQGIRQLWEGDERHKWDIFAWVISGSDSGVLSDLKDKVSPKLVIPAAALFYLYHWNSDDRILEFDDMKILLSVALVTSDVGCTEIEAVPTTRRAVHLATLFVRTALLVMDAYAACGLMTSPVSVVVPHLDAFFNGKLFHKYYQKMATLKQDEMEKAKILVPQLNPDQKQAEPVMAELGPDQRSEVLAVMEYLKIQMPKP